LAFYYDNNEFGQCKRVRTKKIKIKINKMKELIRELGGTIYHNWVNTMPQIFLPSHKIYFVKILLFF